MTAAAASRYNYAGIKQAHLYVVQQALGPVFATLANAEVAIAMHNSGSATQCLANANAIFSTDQIGRFGYDSAGNVWGQAVDVVDPSKAINKPFEITADMVRNLISVEKMGNGL
jgi:hypothetical protein